MVTGYGPASLDPLPPGISSGRISASAGSCQVWFSYNLVHEQITVDVVKVPY